MTMPKRLASIAPPSSSLIEKAIAPPSDPSTKDWMLRNGVDRSAISAKAWKVLMVSIALCSPLPIIALLLAGPLEASASIVAAACAPLVLSSYVANAPARASRKEARSYLRHAPAVIGTMAMSMSLTPSLEKAALLAGAINRDPLGGRLARASWEVLTRHRADLESSLAALASSLDRSNQTLRQSLHLLVASSHEPTRDGMERLMEKAHEMSVQGLRQAAERYLAGLGTPVMIIFGLGILLPIMLLSIVPLFALAAPLPVGAEAASTAAKVPLAPMAFLLLAVVPGSCLLYARSLLESSPIARCPELRPAFDRSRSWPWLVWASSLLALLCLGVASEHPHLFLLAMSLPLSLLLMLQGGLPERARGPSDPERDFIVGLYQLGNRLSTGASLEKAMTEEAAASPATEFSEWSGTVLHRCTVSKIPLEEAMEGGGLTDRWPLLAEALRTVARCAQGDGVAAGRMAVRLAKSLGDILDCEQGIEERLKGTVDMMRSTGVVFAPIVLGVTVGLFGLTSSYSNGEGAASAMTLLAGTYLIELALVVSYLATFLSGGRTWSEMARTFAAYMPTAVLVFTSVSLACRAAFAQW